MKKNILLTGGAGFIGSHTYIALTEAGFAPIILDNLCNSSAKIIERLQQITDIKPEFIQGDIRDEKLLDEVFSQHQISAVIHFAGLKAVGESKEKPIEYYDNNVCGTVKLLSAMDRAGVRNLVFSSSACVYGDPASVPITESFPLSATNPYGRSKIIIEEILTDLHLASSEWNIVCLRYFNPVGAHQSGLIGENPKGTPNNLMPYITQVAVGHLATLSVFGDDYPTPDGFGVRDYIHVLDLAEGHVAALNYLYSHTGMLTVNLGTGCGVSVLQLIKAFEKASNKTIPYKIVGRRPGDVAECFADPALAKQKLNWMAHKTLEDMCTDAWRWQLNNPDGL